MKHQSNRFEKIIKLRIFSLSIALISIFAFVILASFNGGGDSRFLPDYALKFGSSTIVVAIIYLYFRIKFYSNLLKDKYALQQAMYKEKDEYSQFLHEKSGGDVWTTVFILSVIVTVFSAEYNKYSFFASVIITNCLVLVKLIFYIYYRFIYRE